MYIIRKKFRFEMAHKLEKAYTKECMTRIHGHSFILELFFKSKELDENGFIIDFKLVKDKLNDYIKLWDHALVLSAGEDPKNTDHLQDYVDIKFVDYNPTCEAVSKDMYDYIKKIFPNLSKVRLHETEDGYAEYEE